MKRLVPRLIGLLLGASVLLISSCGTSSVVPPTPTVSPSPTPSLTTVACVGDSITLGYGVASTDTYPAQLQQDLGSRYTVLNFGVGGTTANSGGNLPYEAQPSYQQALVSNAQIVLIMLGTNDAKTPNDAPALEATFKSEYEKLVQSFIAMPSHPTVYVMTPIGAVDGNDTIESTLATIIRPQIRQVGADLGLRVIDLESILGGNTAYYQADGIHPVKDGYTLISTAIYKVLAPQ